MAKFLNTSATNYFLEELIKSTRERLILISPFLKFNDRMKELLQDKDRLKIDVRLVYGKSELNPNETNWLRDLEFVRTSFCQNLHAKCYLNESSVIITSMNLYDFSQINNNEMGIFIERDSDPELYKDALEESQRLIRISEQIRIIAETVVEEGDSGADVVKEEANSSKKLSSSKIAKANKMTTAAFLKSCLEKGYLRKAGDGYELTEAGKEAGGESKVSARFGQYFIWPESLSV